MSLLSDFEDRVAGAVEGLFAGVFRSPVQPAELARAASKEMDRRKKLGVGQVYGPTMYSVLLSPEDGQQLGDFAETLAGELETYLVGYAQQHDYHLASRPIVRFLIDDDLKLGRYEVIGEFAPAKTPEPHDEPVSELIQEPNLEVADLEALRPTPAIATLTIPGVEHDVVLSSDRQVLGRLRSCDICVEDKNASREHAAIEREGNGWALTDLDSTNGTSLNGAPVVHQRLRDGDRITIGVTELVFHESRG